MQLNNQHILGSLKTDPKADPEHIRRLCADYLAKRTGSFAFRCKRFEAVHRHLKALGLAHTDTIIDIGAGTCEFDFYLRTGQGWPGIYVPIDGAVDGTNIDLWEPRTHAHFLTCIETIEHLHDPERLVNLMRKYATKGAVLTTPNPQAVDVLGMDSTHIHQFSPDYFTVHGWKTEIVSLFNTPNDTIIAWTAPTTASPATAVKEAA